MYLKVMITIAGGLLLLLAAGCPKGQSSDDSSNTESTDMAPQEVQENPGDDSPVKQSEPSEMATLGGESTLTPEQEGQIRAALLEAASNLSLAYDEAADVITGEGLPAEGIGIPTLISKTADVISSSNVEIEPRTITKIAQAVVADQLPPPEGVDPREVAARTRDKDDEAGEPKKPTSRSTNQIDKSKLKIAKQLIGDWKSTKEIHTRFTAQHNADYYEFLNISPENKILFKVYRDGELISDRTFDYTFNDKNGEIKLKDDNGAVVNSLVAYTMGDVDTTLYLEYKSGTITVYDQVSRVGVPLTEEEKAGVAQPGIGEH